MARRTTAPLPSCWGLAKICLTTVLGLSKLMMNLRDEAFDCKTLFICICICIRRRIRIHTSLSIYGLRVWIDARRYGNWQKRKLGRRWDPPVLIGSIMIIIIMMSSWCRALLRLKVNLLFSNIHISMITFTRVCFFFNIKTCFFFIGFN